MKKITKRMIQKIPSTTSLRYHIASTLYKAVELTSTMDVSLLLDLSDDVAIAIFAAITKVIHYGQ